VIVKSNVSPTPHHAWRYLELLVLGVLLIAGGALRLTHINWDQFQHVHPDERFIVWVADTISWPDDQISGFQSLIVALDPARSTLDPFHWPPDAGAASTAPEDSLAGKLRSYAYGHFPLYLLVLVAHGAQAAARWLGETTIAFPPAFQPFYVVGRNLADYNHLALVGRAISALADLGTLLLVYALGRRAFGRVAGLMAAGAYAFAVLPIQLSHFCTVDMVLTFCVVATIALAARWATGGGGWVTWLGAGALAGLAVGSKFSAILLFLPLLAAACYRLPGLERRPEIAEGLVEGPGPEVLEGRRGSTGASASSAHRSPLAAGPDDDWARKVVIVVMGRMAAALGVSLAVFALTNPFAIIEVAAYVTNVLAQEAMVSGLMDAPYTRQYIGTLPYWYFIRQLSQWGLGWPLGLVAWGGFAWAVVRAGRRLSHWREGARIMPAQAVMLAWAVPYFASVGSFHTKFPRYMAPLLPFLLIFGAGAAVAGYRWLARRWGGRGRVAWSVAMLAVMLFTVGWALAFTGVYRQEHPWIQASRWIYEHIPADSKLLTEHWDDALPLTLDEIPGRPPGRTYQGVELPVWDPDTPEKLDTLVSALSSADYLIIASNRAYVPIQRLPERYPLTSHYYRLLFSGDLGYRRVAEFTVYPRLGQALIPDDHADESFTVYDHPRVFIFANADHLSSRLLRARLGRYLPLGAKGEAAWSVAWSSLGARPSGARHFQSAWHLKVPGHARYRLQAPAPDAPLTLDQPVDTLPVVADFRWNRFASEWAPAAALLWWLVLSIFGWAVWPLLFPLLGGLRDRGYGLSRVAGWLLVGWVHWLGVSLGLWQNRVGAIVAVLGGLILLGLIAWRVQRSQIKAFVAERGGLLLGIEALFGLAFLAFVGIRLLDPDLWQPWNGGEKFMESAFLNAILRSPHFPPYDPYFAGGSLNYYYFGLYLVGLPIKLTGIVPEVAFNLAVPGLFALTATGLFSVGYSLAAGRGAEGQRSRGVLRLGSGRAGERRRVTAAGLGMVLALLMGNLAGLGEVLREVARLGGGALSYSEPLTNDIGALGRGLGQILHGVAPPAYDYWAVSRVIPFTINEFPFWTFLFADLHPHLIAMPFGLLVVGLALNGVRDAEARRQRAEVRNQRSGVREQEVGISAPAAGLPARSPANLPTYRFTNLPTPPSTRHLVSLFTCFLTTVALGALGAINTWDLPTYFLLIAGACVVAGWRRRGIIAAVGGALLAGVMGVLAVVAYWPFYAHYQAQVGGQSGSLIGRYLGWVRGASPLGPWLVVWGFFIFLAYSFILVELRRRPERRGEPSLVAPDGRPTPPSLPGRGAGGVGLALALLGGTALLAVLGRPTAALVVVPLGLALTFAFRRWVPAEDAFGALLLTLGLGILAGTELVYLRDFLAGGEWYRMNTLFKFSVPAWLFLGLVGGVMLPRAWAAAGRRPAWLRVPWQALAVLLLAAGLMFLPLGIPSRVGDRFPGPRPAIGTLDGTAFMTVGRYNWPDGDHTIELAYDYLAIHWLLDHVTGTPVIAEAPAGSYEVGGQSVGYDYYRAGGLRVASLTGFPTFVGQHQYEQRPGDQVGRRTQLGQEFFRTPDMARTRALIQELHVDYIYVGTLERTLFPAESLRKFDVMVDSGELEVVYRNAEVTVYRVVGVTG